MRPLCLLLAFGLCATAQTPADLEAVVTTDLGAFRFEFAPDKAPKHVEQFIRLARQGYYDGSAFFRVVPNGMIQGGDPLLKDPKTPKNLWGSGGLNLLPSEFSDMKHERGVVSTVQHSEQAQQRRQPVLRLRRAAAGAGRPVLRVRPRDRRHGRRRAHLAGPLTMATDKPVRILKVTIETKKAEPFRNASVDELRRTVTLKTTLGTIKIKMEPDWAPNHVRRFLMLTETGWYNGTPFHRIAKGFVVQGGTGETRASGPISSSGPLGAPAQGRVPQRRQTRARHRVDGAWRRSRFRHDVVLSDARRRAASGRQYSAFGRIVEGIDVLAAFEKEEVDGETPKRRLEIIQATIDPN